MERGVSVYHYLLEVRKKRGAGYFVLLDPDKLPRTELLALAEKASDEGADLLLIGGSLLLNSGFDELIRDIRDRVLIPVVVFPGNTMQISQYADAILFLSLISGRNAHFLIGEQVRAAPILEHIGVEPISTGYMLIESGRQTSAEFMSNTRPIPRDKPDIAKATALAAEYLGMRLVYLEAGSGALQPVDPVMIREVADYVNIPLIVGGGIRTPEQARERVQAGASFIVTGNILEEKTNSSLMKEFVDAIHDV